MVVIQSLYPIISEKKDDALEIMAHMTNAALRSEECISFEFFNSLDQPEKILLVQEWTSSDALKKHNTSQQLMSLLAELPYLLSNDIKTTIFTIEPAETKFRETKSQTLH
ncbi:MAG: antibiotic biosynthesis monooxygenase [Proteobacteria bacterium]|nr:antibiotic biosynthesis monooxygenase [Pseudomonadota bacterium]